MENNTTSYPEKISVWKSPWFWAIVGLFVVVLGANITLIFFAVKSSPGLVAKDYYERGRSYTSRTKIEYIRKQKNGWIMDLKIPEKINKGETVLFRVAINGKDEEPIHADFATLFVYRPSDSTKDFSMSMIYERDGEYSVRISFPLKGVWDIIAEVQKGKVHHSLSRRVMVMNQR